jgi:hypothetical protein
MLVFPFVLSLSKDRFSLPAAPEQGQGFDKLSPNGFVGVSN